MLQKVMNADKDIETQYLLHHSSYVDERNRILYVETPKVACTSIKYMLRSLRSAVPMPFSPEDYHTSDVMRIHSRYNMRMPTLGSLSTERRQHVLADPGWFRFCVIRHPYDRFFSAWRDKIFIVEPGFENHQLDKTKKFVEFHEFESKVLNEDARTCDVHWRLQVSLLLPDYITYNHIYDISQVNDLLVDLERHLAGLGVTGKSLILPRNNESWSIRSEEFLTPEITARLRAYYTLDFERFNFPEREASVTQTASATSFVNEYTDAIYDRNRIIMQHIAYTNRQRRFFRGMRYLIRGNRFK